MRAVKWMRESFRAIKQPQFGRRATSTVLCVAMLLGVVNILPITANAEMSTYEQELAARKEEYNQKFNESGYNSPPLGA